MLKFNWNIDSYIYTQFFSSKDDFPQQKPSGSATVMIPKIESSTTKKGLNHTISIDANFTEVDDGKQEFFFEKWVIASYQDETENNPKKTKGSFEMTIAYNQPKDSNASNDLQFLESIQMTSISASSGIYKCCLHRPVQIKFFENGNRELVIL